MRQAEALTIFTKLFLLEYELGYAIHDNDMEAKERLKERIIALSTVLEQSGYTYEKDGRFTRIFFQKANLTRFDHRSWYFIKSLKARLPMI